MTQSDEDALKSIKIFTMKSKSEIEEIAKRHSEAPHQRALQNALADDITIRVHSEKALENAKAASQILFGKSTEESLRSLSQEDFLSVFEGVPQSDVKIGVIEEGIGIIDFMSEHAPVFNSKGEARRALKANSVSINKTKVNDQKMIGNADIINGKYLLAQNGKKNYHLVKFV